jgi:hypothetical protein
MNTQAIQDQQFLTILHELDGHNQAEVLDFLLFLRQKQQVVKQAKQGDAKKSSREIFNILTSLSDDFMANGRNQPPLK